MDNNHIQKNDQGILFLTHSGYENIELTGYTRIHFYRLVNTTPENASALEIKHFFELRDQEISSGSLSTDTISSESAADMVSRELKIVNFQQVIQNNDDLQLDEEPTSPPFNMPNNPSAMVNELTGSKSKNILPPIPRYSPKTPDPKIQPKSNSRQAISQKSSTNAENTVSKFLRSEQGTLYLETPDGKEERVTEYLKVHFKRMLEKDITIATDADIEMWWNLQGSLEPGVSMNEARTQNLLTDALKAAGKLQESELNILKETLDIWIEARKST